MAKRKENSAKKGLVAKTASLKQSKPKAMPEGKSTMARVAEGGPKVRSVSMKIKMGPMKSPKSKGKCK